MVIVFFVVVKHVFEVLMVRLQGRKLDGGT